MTTTERMMTTNTKSINWFVGSNGNLFGDYNKFRYCIVSLPDGGYSIARDGIVIARAPSIADAKLYVKRDV